ncbi:hypothetical protein [Endozoicomonas lisbonensis]|uniref:hypothetical protein n=1 Tax=Endozoicomonas lisbonensis TaxID=3120522 RepID=UPI003395869E
MVSWLSGENEKVRTAGKSKTNAKDQKGDKGQKTPINRGTKAPGKTNVASQGRSSPSGSGGDGGGKKPPGDKKQTNPGEVDTTEDLTAELRRLYEAAINEGEYDNLFKFLNDHGEQLKTDKYTDIIGFIRSDFNNRPDEIISRLPDIIRPERPLFSDQRDSEGLPADLSEQTIDQLAVSQGFSAPSGFGSWQEAANFLMEQNLQGSSLWLIIRSVIRYCIDNTIDLPQPLEDLLWIAARRNREALTTLTTVYSLELIDHRPVRLVRTILYQLRANPQSRHETSQLESVWSQYFLEQFRVDGSGYPSKGQQELSNLWNSAVDHIMSGQPESEFEVNTSQLPANSRSYLLQYLIQHYSYLASLPQADSAFTTCRHWIENNREEYIRAILQQGLICLPDHKGCPGKVIERFQTLTHWLIQTLGLDSLEPDACYRFIARSLSREYILALVHLIGEAESEQAIVFKLTNVIDCDENILCHQCNRYMLEVWQNIEEGILLCDKCRINHDQQNNMADNFRTNDAKKSRKLALECLNSLRPSIHYHRLSEFAFFHPDSLQILLEDFEQLPLAERRITVVRWLRLEFFDSLTLLNIFKRMLISHIRLRWIIDILDQIQQEQPTWLVRDE